MWLAVVSNMLGCNVTQVPRAILIVFDASFFLRMMVIIMTDPWYAPSCRRVSAASFIVRASAEGKITD